MRFETLIAFIAGCGEVGELGADSGESGESSGEYDALGSSEASGAALEPETPERSPQHGLAGNACGEEGRVLSCTFDDGSAVGVQACGHSYSTDDPLRWSACVEELECVPGDVFDCGFAGIMRCFVDGQGLVAFQECGFTPLAIDLGGDGFAFEPAGAQAFDIGGNGACLDVDWPIRSAAWLALDRDGDGAIADGRELFGSGTPMAGGAIASDGFIALATLDDDSDGAITPRDPAFARLVLWSDHDGDRRGTAGELVALAQVGIAAMPLAYERDRECDARGNCVVERASVSTSAGLRPLVDLHLACQ